MNQSNAHLYLPFVQALIDKKTIEYRKNNGNWVARTGNFDFSEPPNCYRIKPEPKYRPWKPEEVPVGALLQHKIKQEGLLYYRGMITHVHGLRVLICSGYNPSMDTLLEYYEHSLDHGKTWQPCGVLE